MARLQGDVQRRALDFAVSVLELTDELPENSKGWEIGRQLIRAGTSIGANLCEADHALTDSDFAHKVSIARKEAAETEYWLSLIAEAGLVTRERTSAVAGEAQELVRILGTMVRKTQAHIRRSKERH